MNGVRQVNQSATCGVGQNAEGTGDPQPSPRRYATGGLLVDQNDLGVKSFGNKDRAEFTGVQPTNRRERGDWAGDNGHPLRNRGRPLAHRGWSGFVEQLLLHLVRRTTQSKSFGRRSTSPIRMR